MEKRIESRIKNQRKRDYGFMRKDVKEIESKFDAEEMSMQEGLLE